MRYKNLHLHSWKVTPKEAIQIQKTLAKNIGQKPKKLNAQTIAGVDVSFQEEKCCAAICIFKLPSLEPIEQKTTITPITFPYIPTLLTFREGPAVLRCFGKIKNVPDVIIFDGQGIAHPRKMGLATHIGIWLDIPTIGCAKTPLYGKFSQPPQAKGSYSPITEVKTIIGAVIRTRDGIKPVFVSVGYKIRLEDAIAITLSTCTKYRLPEPIRAAHTLSKTTLKRKLQR